MKTSSQIDSFLNRNSKVYHTCSKHQRKLKLVCMNLKCVQNGIICLDCFLESHNECKSHIKKLDQIRRELLEQRQTHQKQKEVATQLIQNKIQQLSHVGRQTQSLIANTIHEWAQVYSNIDSQAELETSSDAQDQEIKIVKQFIKGFEQFQPAIQKLDILNSKTDQLVDVFGKIIPKTLVNSHSKQNGYLVVSVDHLPFINSNVQRLRLLMNRNHDLTDQQILLQRSEFLRYGELTHLQVDYSECNQKVLVLNNSIACIGICDTLLKLHININSTEADNTTIDAILDLVHKFKLQELGICFAHTKVDSQQLITQFDWYNESDVLSQIKTITLTNSGARTCQKLNNKFKNIKFL